MLNNRGSYFGLDPADINVIAPGKRTRQGAIPAMALKDGKPFLAWNTPGGDTIPQTLTQAFLNVVEFGMNVQQASGGALHRHLEFPRVDVSAESGQTVWPCRNSWRTASAPRSARWVIPSRACRSSLRMERRPAPGAVKMILIDQTSGVMFGGASPGKDNYVLGW